MRKFATVLLLITASAASTQPPNVPKPPAVPGYEPPLTDVPRVEEKKAEKVLPTVVFVKMKERPIAGCRVVRNDEWHREPSVHVYPVKDGKLVDGWMWRRDADDSEIRVKAGLEVARVAVTFGNRPGEVQIADADDDTGSLPAFLRELVPYSTARNAQLTQRRVSGVIIPVSRSSVELKWRVPGGMIGVHGWNSTLLKSRNALPWVGLVRQAPYSDIDAVTWGREYPDGAVFADVLRNADGKVFEVRVAEKHGGIWERFVAYKNAAERPNGYRPLASKDCRECHSRSGIAAYGGTAIPGGDTIISEPYDVLERGESVQGGNGLSLK